MSTRDDSPTPSVAYARERRRIASAFIIIGCSMTASGIVMYSMGMTFGYGMSVSLGAAFVLSVALGAVLLSVYATDTERSGDRTS